MIIIGLMSGTSVDGIDACIVEVFPDFSFNVKESLVWIYPEKIRQEIFQIIENKASVEEICGMNFVIGECFARAALEVMKKVGLSAGDIDLIGSHGQTVFHKPFDEFTEGFNRKSTLQIGEAAIIAEKTGITTVSDFRPADIAAGGQGAPLVCFADEIIFRDSAKTRAVQNIGGMANVTVVSPDMETFAFDTGPGNVMIDYCVKKFFNQDFDKDGKIAFQGKVDENWLDFLMKEEYFSISPPKTTGRELFSSEYIENALKNAPESPYDIVCTATAFTAKSIFDAYKGFIFPKVRIDEVILGGGGAYNPVLARMLEKYFGDDAKILRHEDFGISSKYKEAVAFAFLAYAAFNKIPNNVPSCTGAGKRKILGKISYA